MDKIGVIEMGLYSVGEDCSGPLGIGVTLPKPQQSGNDPLRTKRRKITANLGANWPFSLFKIKGNKPLGSTPPYSSSSDNRYLISEDLKANELKHGNG